MINHKISDRYVDDEKDLVGKTVAKVIFIEYTTNAVMILFTDGTYTGFHGHCSYEDLEVDWYEPVGSDLVKLGVRSEDEQKAIDKANEEAQRVQRTAERRWQYERLRVEFEGK